MLRLNLSVTFLYITPNISPDDTKLKQSISVLQQGCNLPHGVTKSQLALSDIQATQPPKTFNIPYKNEPCVANDKSILNSEMNSEYHAGSTTTKKMVDTFDNPLDLLYIATQISVETRPTHMIDEHTIQMVDETRGDEDESYETIFNEYISYPDDVSCELNELPIHDTNITTILSIPQSFDSEYCLTSTDDAPSTQSISASSNKNPSSIHSCQLVCDTSYSSPLPTAVTEVNELEHCVITINQCTNEKDSPSSSQGSRELSVHSSVPITSESNSSKIVIYEEPESQTVPMAEAVEEPHSLPRVDSQQVSTCRKRSRRSTAAHSPRKRLKRGWLSAASFKDTHPKESKVICE
jgi:hypothetical protein